jgi:hypothetical protein
LGRVSVISAFEYQLRTAEVEQDKGRYAPPYYNGFKHTKAFRPFQECTDQIRYDVSHFET